MLEDIAHMFRLLHGRRRKIMPINVPAGKATGLPEVAPVQGVRPQDATGAEGAILQGGERKYPIELRN